MPKRKFQGKKKKGNKSKRQKNSHTIDNNSPRLVEIIKKIFESNKTKLFTNSDISRKLGKLNYFANPVKVGEALKKLVGEKYVLEISEFDVKRYRRYRKSDEKEKRMLDRIDEIKKEFINVGGGTKDKYDTEMYRKVREMYDVVVNGVKRKACVVEMTNLESKKVEKLIMKEINKKMFMVNPVLFLGLNENNILRGVGHFHERSEGVEKTMILFNFYDYNGVEFRKVMKGTVKSELLRYIECLNFILRVIYLLNYLRKNNYYLMDIDISDFFFNFKNGKVKNIVLSLNESPQIFPEEDDDVKIKVDESIEDYCDDFVKLMNENFQIFFMDVMRETVFDNVMSNFNLEDKKRAFTFFSKQIEEELKNVSETINSGKLFYVH